MNFLLIDNSNTRTKFALADGEKVLPWQKTLPTASLSEQSIRHALAGTHFDQAVLCSVVPHAAEIIGRALAPAPLHNITHRSHLPIRIDYPKPDQIGADRLANAAAAFRHHGSPCVVIDFGTAVTFDVIDGPDGAYLGGAIAPGVAVLRDYLPDHTALLPRIELSEPPQAIGRSTAEAMLTGAVTGYRGLIREIIQAIGSEMSSPPAVVATGGDAALIARRLPLIQAIDPRLTLEGIRLIGKLNSES